MILPIYTYGHPVLRKQTEEITAEFPELKNLVANMFETMYHADGIGLAAPQIGLAIRLLVIDMAPYMEEDPELGAFKTVMINPEMLEMSEEEEEANEGCLSIPGINEKVSRPEWIKIRYFDLDFNEHIVEFEGFKARVVQHEYDHLEGSLFTDHINPLRRQLIKSRLTSIVKGKAQCDYKIKTA
jgi:peptide deformylase